VNTKHYIIGLSALVLVGVVPTRADVTLPAIFGDHMVLQEEATLPIWGWADPGEKVTVSFNHEQAKATAGPDHKWRVNLRKLPIGTPSGVLSVAGKNTIVLQDVIVGEVWLCSGQSNMELDLKALTTSKYDNRVVSDAVDAIAHAADNQIRLFRVRYRPALRERDDVPSVWEVCSAQSVSNFSAVGYFFGKNLRMVLNRPMGLIDSSVGATAAQSWTDLATLNADPALRHYVENYRDAAAKFPGGDAEFTASGPTVDPITHNTLPKGAGRLTPTMLFNGMIAPLIPFAIKGVIWYQGEDNSDSMAPGGAREYRKLFPAMIEDWRTRWQEGDFPFLFVQLASYAGPSAAQSPAHARAHWPMVRESQLETLSLPKTGMAVAIDIGAAHQIHPPDKADVGLRLSLAARHIAYGENVVCAGPIFDSAKAETGRMRVWFKPETLGHGLVIGISPWKGSDAENQVSTNSLAGFELAGEDRKWAAAQAVIEGKTVVVSCPAISHPVAVRYAWADNPICNLYNQEGLPASPFRTDDWDPTQFSSVSE
jgi:sialate O-acetylesterase